MQFRYRFRNVADVAEPMELHILVELFGLASGWLAAALLDIRNIGAVRAWERMWAFVFQLLQVRN